MTLETQLLSAVASGVRNRDFLGESGNDSFADQKKGDANVPPKLGYPMCFVHAARHNFQSCSLRLSLLYPGRLSRCIEIEASPTEPYS